ncbi:MAG: 16S rRNA (cytosine(1402)-N(4))-methyltransferase RsmH [Parcubacteria group bacterium]|nr:16S rRNA (cytosine(1402)-N(4))-methyltransferase RsmH [Parcubacteria group bacterium]
MLHKTVLLQSSIEGLDIKTGDTFLDGTLGGGGHSEMVLKKFCDKVRVIGLDLDEKALDRSKIRLSSISSSVTFHKESFRNMNKVLDELGLKSVDKILFDLGLSSNQFEESGRGFTFQKDEPLLMTFKENISPEDITAEEIINNWDEENIVAILEGYGEERFAKRIARAIVVERKKKLIKTTFDLVGVIKMATPTFYHRMKIHPATKTFQALRIAVNDEVESLKEGITKGFERLSPKGRMAVISFHSLEDRVVKNYFREKNKAEEAVLITKKPIVPTREEILENPRSRSAKLRIIQKN